MEAIVKLLGDLSALIISLVFYWKGNMGEELKKEILSILPRNVKQLPLQLE